MRSLPERPADPTPAAVVSRGLGTGSDSSLVGSEAALDEEMDEFVHLHVHSNYSLKEGASSPEDLAAAAAEAGTGALALTDHDGVYGAVRFTQACRHAGIRPILGAELEWGDGYHATLLARDERGWANLCRLITGMHLSERAQTLPPGKRPRTTFDSIAQHSEGLLALSGCDLGEVAWLTMTGRYEEAVKAARRWREVFGEDFAIEVSNHLRPDDNLRNHRLMEIAREVGIRVAATNDVHYIEEQDAVVHDVLDCIRRIVPLTPSTAPRENAEYRLKPPHEMAALHPPEAISGARWAADRCTFELSMDGFHFPEPQVGEGESSTSVLARRAWEGVRRRYRKAGREVEARLQHELRMIRRAGFCGYFLLVSDIAEHAREVLGIPVACRGSAAGSLVAYALRISDVDPIAHDLVFERFMNPHRREIPDIDLDFPSNRRPDVIRYILEAYGERTAAVAMMETFRARAAIREVGKALGLPPGEVDFVAKAFPHISASKISEAVESLPEVASMNLDSSRLETLFDLASRLDGFPRHLALHPSGVILSDERLADVMPMQRSFDGFLMSQFDKDDVEALGIAKLDVLGVRMLAAMAHALDEIERTEGERVDLDRIPTDDEATFGLIRDSRTMGCFQIESPGQRELLGKFQPEVFEDLIVDISLFRPGPVKGDMVAPFLMRRHRFEPTVYPHPSLRSTLRETNGVIVYHEQVMRVISALCGCDLADSDRIRRLLEDEEAAKGLGEEMVNAAVSRGWERQAAAKVWAAVVQFASFGFCKAHAAAFAVPTYRSAWLKTHHPAAFYCGVLTHDPGMYPRRAILSDARAHGVPILPVDINKSGAEYRVEIPVEASPFPRGFPGRTCEARIRGVRLGLQDVKGISKNEIASIIDGRPWHDLSDFSRRAEVSRDIVLALVHCGAFDSVKGGRPRRELLWEVEESWVRRRRSSEQMTLDLTVAEPLKLPGIEEYTLDEKVEAELEVLGLDATRHLIDLYRDDLEKLGWTPASGLLGLRGGSQVVVAGVKVATQTPPVRSGNRVIFLTVEDGTGQADAALFGEVQAKYARCVFDSWILAIRGTLRRTGDKGVSVVAEEVIDLARRRPPPAKLWHSSGGSAGR